MISPVAQFESPFAKAAPRTIQQTPDGKYLVNGTLVASDGWTPEVGERVTTLNAQLQPTGSVQYVPPALPPSAGDRLLSAIEGVSRAIHPPPSVSQLIDMLQK
jgi:hypothetical protein